MPLRLAIFILPLLTAACAYQTPARTDPLADLLGSVKLVDSPLHMVEQAAQKRLGLIVSTSSETQFRTREEQNTRYLDGYVRSWEPGSYDAIKSLQTSVGPRRLVDGVVAELRPRFSSVTVVSDFTEFRQKGLDIAAVLDVGMEGKTSNSLAKLSAEYTTEVTLIFFDPQIRRIGAGVGKAIEHGERSWGNDNVKALFLFLPDPKPEEIFAPLVAAEKHSRETAFARLKESLDALLRN